MSWIQSLRSLAPNVDSQGGTGSSSRLIPRDSSLKENWTVAAVVQANYGGQEELHICSVPVGKLWVRHHGPRPPPVNKDGSIIIIVGTDCPLLPNQCEVWSREKMIECSDLRNGRQLDLQKWVEKDMIHQEISFLHFQLGIQYPIIFFLMDHYLLLLRL
jgi:hypothetical protein